MKTTVLVLYGMALGALVAGAIDNSMPAVLFAASAWFAAAALITLTFPPTIRR